MQAIYVNASLFMMKTTMFGLLNFGYPVKTFHFDQTKS